MKIPPAPDAAQFSLDGLDDDIFKGSRRVASAILAITQTLVRMCDTWHTWFSAEKQSSCGLWQCVWLQHRYSGVSEAAATLQHTSNACFFCCCVKLLLLLTINRNRLQHQGRFRAHTARPVTCHLCVTMKGCCTNPLSLIFPAYLLRHLQAFVPLFVIVVLQDVHLKMGVVLSTALCICLAVGNYWFHRMQVVKVRQGS